MAGIIFPNVAGTLAPLIQMDRQAEESRLNRERLERHDQWVMQDRAEARDLQKQQRNLQLDAAQRQKLKEASDWTTQAALGVLNSPPEHRAAAYQAALQEGKIRGFDLSNLPPAYSPGLEGMLHFYVKKAQSVNDFLKQEADRPQPMQPVGGSPGGAPTTVAPDATKTGQEHVSYLTSKHGLSPVAAAGVVGNLYQESGFDPGYGFTRPGGDNGTAHGMAQWRLDRADALKAFAAQQGKPPTDPNVQLDFLVQEMKGGDMGAQRSYALLQQAKTPEEAALAMMHFFRPEGYTPGNPQAGHGFQQRVQYARRFMPNAEHAVLRGPPGQPEPIGAYTPGTAQMVPAGGQQVAQSGGAPVVPQGDAVAGQGDAPPSAAPQGQQQEVFEVRRWLNSAFPGAVPFAVKGQPVYDAQKNLMVRMPDGSTGWVAVPKQKEPRQEGPKTLEERDREMLLRGDPADPAYAAAYAHLGAERVIPDPNSPGGFIRIRPDLSWARRPTFAGANAPQPATPPLPGGKEVQVDPGRGKPLDNSARDDLTKASGGVLELTELVKSFKPEFGGYITGAAGDVANFVKMRLPDALGGGDPTGQAQWWQRYALFANLERNKLFGSALTPGETAAFNKAMVDPGMRPEQIKENLARQQEIGAKALSRIANSMKASGYNQEAIETVTGLKLNDMPSPMGGVPQAQPAPKGNRPPLESFQR